jgi:hypothetical protein
MLGNVRMLHRWTDYMRRWGGLFGALVVALLLCPAGRARAQTSVTFADPNLEVAVRGTLGKPTGPLTADDLQGLIYFYAGSMQITNLSGLEYATNTTGTLVFTNAQPGLAKRFYNARQAL